MLVQSPIWCTLKDKMENEMTLVKDDLVTATKLVQDFLKPVAGEVPPTYIERMYTLVEVARLVGEERRSNLLVDAHVRKGTPLHDARRFDPVEEARRNPITPFVPVRTTAVKHPVHTPEVIVAQKPRKPAASRKPAAPKPAKP